MGRRPFDFSTARGAFELGALLGALLCGVLVFLALRSPEPSSSRTDHPSHGVAPGPSLLFPVPGGSRDQLQGGFRQRRGDRAHEAVDIAAPRGTSVLAVSDGTLASLSSSPRGGLGLYLRDARFDRCYYYAHLDRYAPGLSAGRRLVRGEILGYVGSTGNAAPNAPHLHFEVRQVDAGQPCSQGKAVDPASLLSAAHARPDTPRASP